ncbi:DUF742 domain-containing protein [Dactylosporangium sp. NPDC005555]|uniref:DUF742 domain-containing protein n=1 Tax=Dactylosporangium sp. NPDC005555 TaxID=3154889 RepID=UPI0033BB8D44
MTHPDSRHGPRHDPGTGRPAASAVRPYLLTGGRARPDAVLEIEAQVLTTAAGEDALDRHRYEQREIVLLCRRPLAVAEVAARLGLHLGVARVLVGDLVACGHLAARRPDHAPHRNVAIIERVIRGLQAIH